MGMYLEVDSKGVPLGTKGKAERLVADGAIRQTVPTYVHDRSVCVADNGHFEAAAFAFSPEEFAVFLMPDGRPKHWLEATPEQIAANFPPARIASYREELQRGYR